MKLPVKPQTGKPALTIFYFFLLMFPLVIGLFLLWLYRLIFHGKAVMHESVNQCSLEKAFHRSGCFLVSDDGLNL